MLATRLVRVEIIAVFSGLGLEIAPGQRPKDAHALMWKVLENGTKSLAVTARRLLQAAQEWSRPILVAVHAIADVRLTKADLIAENALLRQQLIAAKRHRGQPLLSKPEKVATTIWDDTREVVYEAVTYHPTQEWTAQQLRNATYDMAPRFLIRDGDGRMTPRPPSLL